MKSLPKVHSPTADTQPVIWNVADLDIESNVIPADDQREQILALFGTGQKNISSERGSESHSALHPQGIDLSLANWQPADLGSQSDLREIQQWDLIESPADFFKIPEQQVWKDKSNSETERIKLLQDAHLQADEILRAAQAEADKIILHAQNEIDQAKQAGYQAARDELQTALDATHTMIEETRQWQATLLKDGEQILIGMLKEIAQTMFGDGVRLDANALQINLNRIMENAQRLGDLNIFLNPQDANLLDSSWSNYQLLVTGNKVRIVPSEKILPGGCIIKGINGVVDARVETQLAAVLNMIGETSEAGK